MLCAKQGVKALKTHGKYEKHHCVQLRGVRIAVVFSDGAGYGNRTRLCGLGSDRSTDELTLHIKLLEQGPGILRRLRRLRVSAHFLLALPKAAMPCIAPSYDGKMLVIEPCVVCFVIIPSAAENCNRFLSQDFRLPAGARKWHISYFAMLLHRKNCRKRAKL